MKFYPIAAAMVAGLGVGGLSAAPSPAGSPTSADAVPVADEPQRVDFRYSPPEWQSAICLPDDPQKSLVAKDGSIFNAGPRLAVEVAPGAVWQKQESHSPRVPIVRTYRTAPGLEIVEEAFAVAEPLAVVVRRVDGDTATRADVILIQVTNTGAEERTIHPKRLVDGKPEDLPPVLIQPGRTADLVVQSGGQLLTPEEAMRARQRAVDFWQTKAGLPFGRITVPDPGIQALVDSSVRNIWQAREIKNGLPVFQVGPTCYRGLWIVDGAFLLDAATMIGAGDQARNGVAYELTHQKEDGRIEVMKNYPKENGIVLWTCVRHARMTRDKAWLASVWPKLRAVAGHIKKLRNQSLGDPDALFAGLGAPGHIDGGLDAGREGEYSTPHWNLIGLRAFIQGARWLGNAEEADLWQQEYDDFMAAFRRASQRDLRKDSHGNSYVPIQMGPLGEKELPQRGQWTFCQAVYPGEIFAPDDPLVAGTLAMLQATEREGMVHGTGWDATGIWNYFASFYAHAWLWQGDGPKAARLLYAFANHAAPVLNWREEQALRGNPYKIVGDMPHNWAGAEFIRLVVHLLALARGDELHLLQGLPAAWTKPGLVTELDRIATPFGSLTMQLRIAEDGKSARLHVEPLPDASCRKIVVHLNGLTVLDPKVGGDLTIPLDVSPAKP
jgi:hypothetical protein